MGDTWEQPAPAEPAIHQEWATPKNTQNHTRHRILYLEIHQGVLKIHVWYTFAINIIQILGKYTIS